MVTEPKMIGERREEIFFLPKFVCLPWVFSLFGIGEMAIMHVFQ